MIISVLNLKGGAGKTTIATNLAAAFARKDSTLLLDTDIQRSSMQWFNSREKEERLLTAVSITEPNNLKKQIPVLADKFSCIVIDGAPHTDISNAICIYLSDLILIPVTPSPYDLWATRDFLERIDKAREMNSSLQALFVLNRFNEQTAIAKDTLEALGEMHCPLAKTRLHNRVVYADAAISGLSVLESRNRQAKEEFESLFREVRSCCRKLSEKKA